MQEKGLCNGTLKIRKNIENRQFFGKFLCNNNMLNREKIQNCGLKNKAKFPDTFRRKFF